MRERKTGNGGKDLKMKQFPSSTPPRTKVLAPPSRRVDTGDDEAAPPTGFRMPSTPQRHQVLPGCTRAPSSRRLDRMESFASHSTAAELDFLASSSSICSGNTYSRMNAFATTPPHLFRLTTQSSARRMENSSMTSYHRRPGNPMATVLRQQISGGSYDSRWSELTASTTTTCAMTLFSTPPHGGMLATTPVHTPATNATAPAATMRPVPENQQEYTVQNPWQPPSSSFEPFRRMSM